MRLSPAAELAIRGVLVLAACQADGPVTLETICRRRKLPKQYLTKIFGALGRAGLVTPIRGKRGGYLLSRRPEKITLGQITQFVEAVSDEQKRSSITSGGLRRGDFSLNWAWDSIDRDISEILDNITLRDLAEREMQSSDAYSSSYVI